MKTDHRRLWVVLVLSVVGLNVPRVAGEEMASSAGGISSESSELQREAIRLIRQDAEKKRTAAIIAAKQANEGEGASVSAQAEGGVVLLEAFDVQGQKEIPNFEAPPETTVAKFFRTGNFSQHIGKKVTTRFWASGNAGLVLSFRW